MNGPIVMAISDNSVADTDERIFIGKGDEPAWLTFALANRHGLVTGATGTGKTVSLQVMAEGFARAGVPVFAADIKGTDGNDDPLAPIRKAAQGFGNVTKATVGTIQRQLLVLENQGGTKFFGEPALSLKDFMRTDRDGRGMINILVADHLMQNPRLYATFLLWMLSELFEELPEAGDPPKPKLVFFFDEAHLLFNDAPKALMDKIEQVVRLIRSKGVGVHFVTQNPIDVPDKVLAQLGNRVQHALRAFTPRDQKAVTAAAQTFRPNPKLDTARVIMELGKGEAL